MAVLPVLLGILVISTFVDADVVGGRRPSSNNAAAACRSFYTCEAGDEDMVHDSTKGCYCDQKCSLYDDCCSNAAGLGLDWEAQRELAAASVCTKLPSRLTGYYLVLVTQCPESFADDNIRSKCEDTSLGGSDTLLRLPVTETEHGFVFRNVYCAFCHGFTREAIMFWGVSYKCAPPGVLGEPTNATIDQWELLNHRPLAEVLAMMGECDEHFTRPSTLGGPRGCVAGLVDTCPAEWNDIEVAQKCDSEGTRIVSLQHAGYKNKYCAQCNDVARFDCRNPSTPGTTVVISSLPASIVPLSILIDFNAGSGTMDDRDLATGRSECNSGQIYDVFKDICRDLVCGPGFQLEKHSCVSEASAGAKADVMSTDISVNVNISCALVKLAADEFTILDNGTLLLLATDTRVPSSRFVEHENGTVAVCSDDYLRNQKNSRFTGKYDFDRAQGILSLVGTIISIIALIVLLTVYGSFRVLRNVPGRCLMCLAASLCGAQLLFIIGMYTSQIEMLCRVIGILTHLFFLIAFCWMSVMAFDVWRTFHRQFRVSSRSRKVSKFPVYCTFTALVPLILVTLSIAFDYVEAPNIPSPGYGNPFCWINNKEGLFYLFVLPIFIIILTNCIFFAISVYHIYHASLASAKVLRKGKEGANRKRVLLYAKLSTIMGLTWVFGFAAALTNNTVLWYLFIIFNSLQGLFICLAFLCNRKVHRLVSSRASRISRTSQTYTTSSGQSNPMLPTASYRKKAHPCALENQQLKQTS